MRVVDLAITPLKIIEIFIIKSFYRHACHCRINDVVKTASIRLAFPHQKNKRPFTHTVVTQCSHFNIPNIHCMHQSIPSNKTRDGQ